MKKKHFLPVCQLLLSPVFWTVSWWMCVLLVQHSFWWITLPILYIAIQYLLELCKYSLAMCCLSPNSHSYTLTGPEWLFSGCLLPTQQWPAPGQGSPVACVLHMWPHRLRGLLYPIPTGKKTLLCFKGIWFLPKHLDKVCNAHLHYVSIDLWSNLDKSLWSKDSASKLQTGATIIK